MNNLFVTGATGFVGQHLVKKLDQNNFKIKILSRSLNLNYETVVCDLESQLIPKDSLDGIDTIFHLAGVAHDSGKSSKNDNHYHSINVDASINLARLAVKSKVKRFIYVSSVKAGGKTNTNHCLTEKNQSEPEGIYGETKRNAEIKLLDIGLKSDMHVSIIRPSLIYGPNVKGNLKQMKQGIENGWFPPLPELHNRRSMIHVDDLVNALMLVAEDNRANGEIYIATDGKKYSSRQIYEALCYSAGKSPPKWFVPKVIFTIISKLNSTLEYKVEKLLGDECYSSKKLELLGFKPQYSIGNMNETNL